MANKGVISPRQAEIEHKVSIVLQSLLGKTVGLTDGFFDLGIDSLMAVTTIDIVNREFGIELDVATLFHYSNIRAVSEHIAKLEAKHNVAAPPGDGERPAARRDDPGPARDERYPDYIDSSVAIIGMSCEFPGSKDHHVFWQNMLNGREGLEFLAPERLEELDVPARIRDNPAFVPVRMTMEGKDLFDPEFFKISARDAQIMDPQLRLLLQHSWKAVEDAGYQPRDVADACVFASTGSHTYLTPAAGGANGTSYTLENFGDYQAWLLSQSGTIPTLISYKLGLKGPSYAVHSNCSSSLVGLQLAFQSIVRNETTHALVGAASLSQGTGAGYVHQKGLNFSSDGHIRTFDAAADGMVASEGVAVVLLKNTKAALEDGDNIYGLIRGVAMNNDGSEKAGFYAPSVKGQAEVIKKALSSAGIHPDTISYVEAHGTATSIGDPIEFAALQSAFGSYTSKRQFCGLGSVKSNIGHTDTAAGLAGVIKVALSLHHEEVPPTINFKQHNAKLDLSNSSFYIASERTALGPERRPHRAGVSSFGIGGTNTHAILEQVPVRSRTISAIAGDGKYLVPLSARSTDRLKDYATALLEFVRSGAVSEPDGLAALAFTLQTGREAMDARLAMTVTSVSDLEDKLRAYLGGASVPGLYHGQLQRNSDTLGALSDDEDMAGVVDAWIAKGKLDGLLDLWVKGFSLEWRKLYGAKPPRRMSLPTYPFAKHRQAPAAAAAPPAVTAPARRGVSRSSEVTDTLLFTPAWKARAVDPGAQRPNFQAQLVILCDIDGAASLQAAPRPSGAKLVALPSRSQGIQADFTAYAESILAEIQAMVRDASGGQVLVQVVVPALGERIALLGLSGLLRSIHQELPAVACQLIALAEPAEPQSVIAKIEDCARAASEQSIKYDRSGRHVLEWNSRPAGPLPKVPWRDGGTYLITGGAGGLGRIFSKEIARSAPGCALILAGRSARSPQIEQQLRELTELGAKAMYRQADLSDPIATEGLIRSARAELPSSGGLNGIIHAAGIVRDRSALRKTAQELREVFAPKVAGLVNLDQASSSEPLDFFLCFSSASGAIGNAGQADYGAANAFMGAYASYRNSLCAAGKRTGRTLAIDWALWRDGGMQVSAAIEDVLAQRTGLVPMHTSSGINALYRSFAMACDEVIAAEGIPARVAAYVSAFDHREPRAAKPESPASSSEPPSEVAVILRDKFAKLLKLDPKNVSLVEPLSNYGADSIALTEFTGELLDQYGFDLPLSVLVTYPTLSTLAAYLSKAYASAFPGAADPPGVTAPAQAQVPAGNAGAVPAPAPARDAYVALSAELVKRFCALLKLKEANIDLSAPMSDYGADSIALVELADELSDHFHIKLSPDLLAQFPSLGSLAEHLAKTAGQR